MYYNQIYIIINLINFFIHLFAYLFISKMNHFFHSIFLNTN